MSSILHSMEVLCCTKRKKKVLSQVCAVSPRHCHFMVSPALLFFIYSMCEKKLSWLYFAKWIEFTAILIG